MPALLSIGEFSRVTHLSVKALRHYDDVGLLEPADVDPSSGYRRYAAAQVPVAQVIRRFRDMDMPIDTIRQVLAAPDRAARDEAIVAHLRRMEDALAQTQQTVASLRAMLEGTAPSGLPVEFRFVPAQLAVAVRGEVEWDATEPWLERAQAEVRAALADSPDAAAGPDAALYSVPFFEAHVGEVLAYVPISRRVAVSGRVELVEVPSARLAVTLHEGPFADIDQAYGALGTFVAERALGAPGPIREHYLAEGRTEVAWPVVESDTNPVTKEQT
jgi:DNA-binding transcriptional MerR regulator